MKRETFFLLFPTESAAEGRMKLRNNAYRAAGNHRDHACMMEHPEGWVVCDLKTAIESEMPYKW